ncbi:hypothetical protein SISNIDRAFT_449287 [Sistotremastrum niveocremeum HHB9708]|uniref:Uncharacterized protein n=1 Tax=Sistotremastrum niveocremeum HHB9708 TaxID=1314777 RepID=A0A164ZI49_9AGAM|nr:hypothetical protein SISNIDRAFT_449287 [Sistotremastrum niveocremeum HHB9708]
MSNINDPASVLALLDQLRASAAYNDIATIPSETQAPPVIKEPSVESDEPSASDEKEVSELLEDIVPAETTSTEPEAEITPNISSSISSLLSKLTAPPQPSAPPAVRHYSPLPPTPVVQQEPVSYTPPPPPVPRPSILQHDRRSMTFQQALPILATFGDNDDFREDYLKLKSDQELMEKVLFEEREKIKRSFEDKVKVATSRAQITGVNLSAFDMQAMQSKYVKALDRHAIDRVLPAWDGLVAKQQDIFEKHCVPTMFLSKDKVVRSKQQKVIDVLDGIMQVENDSVL